MKTWKNRLCLMIGLSSLMLLILLSIGSPMSVSKADEVSAQPKVSEVKPMQTEADASEEWLTDEEWQAYKEATDKIWEIQSAYTDDKGYVKSDRVKEVLDAVGQHAKELKQAGVLAEYEVSHIYGNVYLKFASGIPYVYQPVLEGVLSGPGPEEKISISSLYVITFPELNFLQNGFIKTREKWAGSIAALRTVDAAFDNYTFQEERYFGEINLETILQAFGPNRLVLWSGHGSYLVRDGACLDTEIKVSEREEMTTYADGIKEGWYIICDGTLGLTTAFFRDRCQDMTNSFILLSSCYVMEDANLSDIFLKKGAGAVVGFNNTVSNKYALRMFRRILQVMCKKNPGTKKYYTVSEALNQARERYGDSDPLGDAETVLAGDSNWRLREEDIAGGCELSGIVYQTKREEKVVPGACVYLYDTDLNLLAATTTDAGGRFGFGGLDEKVMGVYVRDGNSTKIRRIELTKDTSLVFHMQEPIDIYGDVWEEGGNGEGVEVRVFVFDKTGDKRLTSVTGKGGSFRITVDGPGFYTISFQKEGYDAVVQHVEVDKEELRVHADMYKSQKQSTPDTPQTSPKITPNPKATEVPKAILSVNQTATPTGKPTPTAKSTTQPTTQPTAVPTTAPTVTPTWEQIPTASPTLSPPSMPTVTPTVTLFPTPTITPTVSPAAI